MNPLKVFLAGAASVLMVAMQPAAAAQQPVDFSTAHGEFSGLLTGSTAEDSGWIRVQVNADGTGVCTVTTGRGLKWKIPVSFSMGGPLCNSFSTAGPNGSIITGGFPPVTDSSGSQTGWDVLHITGTCGGIPYIAYLKNTAAVAPASFTFLVSGSDAGEFSAGFGTISVSAKGIARVVLTFSDGDTFTAGAPLNADGSICFLARKGGTDIAGFILFASDPEFDCIGSLRVFPKDQPPADLDLIGSLYVNRAPLLSLETPSSNVGLELSSALFTSSVNGTLGGDNCFAFPPMAMPDSRLCNVTLKTNLKSGSFTGTAAKEYFRDKRSKFRGVILQKQNTAVGFASGGIVVSVNPLTSGGATGGGTIKTGAGTLTICGGNTYTGPGGVIGSGTLTIGGTSTLVGGSSAYIGGSLGANAVIITGGYSGGTLSAGLTNGGSYLSGLTKVGSGALVLSGSNTFTGTTTPSGGTISLNTIGASVSGISAVTYAGSTTISGGILNLGTTLVSSTSVSVANGAALRLTGGSTSGSTLTLYDPSAVGGGTLTVSSGSYSLIDFSGGYIFPTGTSATTGTINFAAGVRMSVPYDKLNGTIILGADSRLTVTTGSDSSALSVTLHNSGTTGSDSSALSVTLHNSGTVAVTLTVDEWKALVDNAVAAGETVVDLSGLPYYEMVYPYPYGEPVTVIEGL